MRVQVRPKGLVKPIWVQVNSVGGLYTEYDGHRLKVLGWYMCTSWLVWWMGSNTMSPDHQRLTALG